MSDLARLLEAKDRTIAAHKARAEAAEAEVREFQKAECLRNWDSVNDPPCHPSDTAWKPCPDCMKPFAQAKAMDAFRAAELAKEGK